MDNFIRAIGVAKRCSGCTCTPRVEKKIGGVIYRVSCKCTQAEVHPQAEQEVICCWAGESWRAGVVNLALLACIEDDN